MFENPRKAGLIAVGYFLFRASVVFAGLFLIATFVMNRIEDMPTETERCAKRLEGELVDTKGTSPLEALKAWERAEIQALAICSGSSRR